MMWIQLVVQQDERIHFALVPVPPGLLHGKWRSFPELQEDSEDDPEMKKTCDSKIK